MMGFGIVQGTDIVGTVQVSTRVEGGRTRRRVQGRVSE